MSKVLIQTTPTSYRVRVAPSGMVFNSNVNIYRHCQEFTERDWDNRERRWRIKKQYRHYDRRTSTLYLPRYDLSRFCSLLVQNNTPYEIEEIPLTEGKIVDFEIPPWFTPKSPIQAAAIRNCVVSPDPIRGIALQPGAGKAQPLSTPLKTPTGWILMRDVAVGTELMSGDGTITRVTGVYPQGIRAVWEVTLSDGRSTECCIDHLWKVSVNESWCVMTTEDVREHLFAKDRVGIPKYGNPDELDYIVSIKWAGRYAPMQCLTVDHPDRLYTCNDDIVTHNTATSLVAAGKIGRRTLIKTPILINQWVGSVMRFLSIKEDEIYIISGWSSILKLLEEIDKTIFPKVILASLQTLRDYANDIDNYRLIPPMSEFTKRCDIGLVIEDEVHMHFHAALITDMIMTPKVLIPMSATFEVTSKDIHPIFEGHFPPKIRFGEDQYVKYVLVSSYSYTLSLHQIAKSQYRTGHGYMHAAFEKDMLKKKAVLNEIMEEVYLPILHAEYFNYALPGEKLLIICTTTEMCAYMVKYLQKLFPDKKIAMFIAGSPESVKQENDIVISTVKSSGVGFDMPNLITTFVTVAADSPPLNKQLLGRLREIEGRSPRLAYASCLTIGAHVKYMNTRRRIFPSLAKSFSHHAL